MDERKDSQILCLCHTDRDIVVAAAAALVVTGVVTV